MWKEISIITVIIGIIIAGNIIVQQHLEKSSIPIIENLETIYSTIENSENADIEKAKKIVEQVEQQWEDVSKTWTMIVMHSELDQIEIALINTKTAIDIENVEDACIELKKTIFLLEHIKEKDAFKLKNIF